MPPLTSLPTWPVAPRFPDVCLEHRRRELELEAPPPPYAADASTTTKPPKETRPLAAAPQPAKHYSQYECPICHAPIADRHGANFIGHVPCLHRGPCANTSCVRAYYGTGSKWANPYTGRRPLFCQAPGCGRRPIEQWYYVEAIMGPSGRTVITQAQVDPAKTRAWEDARSRMRRAEEEERKREERRKRKADRESDTLTGSRFLDCCLCVALCCCDY